MSALIVDTSSWISYFDGRKEFMIDDALSEGRVYLTPLVAAELTSGKLSSKERNSLEEVLRFLPLYLGDAEHWLRVGQLRSFLRGQGMTVSTPDAHVTQCALDLNAELLTEDKIFAKITKYFPLRLLLSKPIHSNRLV